MDSTLLLISSSKSYDYTVGNKFGATVRDKNTHYSAVLVCNIAPDRKYDAYTSCTFPHAPVNLQAFAKSVCFCLYTM